MIVIFASMKMKKVIAQKTVGMESCSRGIMCQNLKRYQLVTEKNIAGIVVICVNMQEDTKSFIALGVADLI